MDAAKRSRVSDLFSKTCKCGVATDNYCQICKKTMCRDCLTDHSHGMDK